MKLIATYIHDDHTSVKNHGEYTERKVYTDSKGRTRYAFVQSWGEVEWSDALLTSMEDIGDETHVTIDWRGQ